jgi:CRP-like cAMP-binding protein
MRVSSFPATANRLLAALPDRTRQHLLANSEYVPLEFAEVIFEEGKRIRHVHFPIDGFISLAAKLDDSSLFEVGMIGNEGMLGASLFLGTNISSQHALVQGVGHAIRIRADTFQLHCQQSAALQQIVAGYVHFLMSQLAQVAACTHRHRVEARLPHWLLMTRDRTDSDRFRLTHELLACMLGVRRAGISRAANALHKRGLIRYSRGEITILDGAGLEAASCSCYRKENEMYEQTVGSLARSAKLRFGMATRNIKRASSGLSNAGTAEKTA